MFRQTLGDSKLPVRLVECCLLTAAKLGYIVDFFLPLSDHRPRKYRSMFKQSLGDSTLPVRLVECLLMAVKLGFDC